MNTSMTTDKPHYISSSVLSIYNLKDLDALGMFKVW